MDSKPLEKAHSSYSEHSSTCGDYRKPTNNMGGISGLKSKLSLPTALWIVLIGFGICFLALLSSLCTTLRSLDELIAIEQASIHNRRVSQQESTSPSSTLALKRADGTSTNVGGDTDNEAAIELALNSIGGANTDAAEPALVAFVENVNVNFNGDSNDDDSRNSNNKDKDNKSTVHKSSAKRSRKAKKRQQQQQQNNDIDLLPLMDMEMLGNQMMMADIEAFAAEPAPHHHHHHHHRDHHHHHSRHEQQGSDDEAEHVSIVEVEPQSGGASILFAAPEGEFAFEQTATNNDQQRSAANDMAAQAIMNSLMEELMRPMMAADASGASAMEQAKRAPKRPELEVNNGDQDMPSIVRLLFSSMSPMGDEPELNPFRPSQQQQRQRHRKQQPQVLTFMLEEPPRKINNKGSFLSSSTKNAQASNDNMDFLDALLMSSNSGFDQQQQGDPTKLENMFTVAFEDNNNDQKPADGLTLSSSLPAPLDSLLSSLFNPKLPSLSDDAGQRQPQQVSGDNAMPLFLTSLSDEMLNSLMQQQQPTAYKSNAAPRRSPKITTTSATKATTTAPTTTTQETTTTASTVSPAASVSIVVSNNKQGDTTSTPSATLASTVAAAPASTMSMSEAVAKASGSESAQQSSSWTPDEPVSIAADLFDMSSSLIDQFGGKK